MDEKELSQRLADVESNLADMRHWIDQELSQLQGGNKQSRQAILSKLDSTARAVSEIKSVVFGNATYRLTGILVRMEKIELALEKVVEAREAQKNQLAGIQTGLKVVQYLLATLGTSGLGAILILLSGIAE